MNLGELEEMGKSSLTFVGVVAELCFICTVVFVVHVARAGVVRLVDGGEYNYFPTTMGTMAGAMVLFFALLAGTGIFRALGGANFMLGTDLFVLMKTWAKGSTPMWQVTALIAVFFGRHLASFVAGIFTWLLVGAEYGNYPASIGIGAVPIAQTSGNGWAVWRIALSEMAVAFFFAFVVLVVFDRYRHGTRVKYNNNPNLALAGVALALCIGAAFISTPVLFPALETGPGIVHAWSRTYAAGSTRKWTEDLVPNDCIDPAVTMLPYTSSPHIYTEPWLSCLNDLKADVAEQALTTWTRMFGGGRIHPEPEDATTVKLTTDFNVRAIFVAKVVAPIVGQIFAFFAFWAFWWRYKHTPFGEGRTMASRVATSREPLLLSDAEATGCGPTGTTEF